MNKKSKRIRVNEQIRQAKVRLIGNEGEQLGVVDSKEALKKAQEHDLDLVEIAPEAAPPVCRIMDFSKFKYDQKKKERELKKKQRNVHVKEIKLKPKIGEHDYLVKLGKVEKFLKRGDRVKITMWFRGREKQHKERGKEILDRMAEDMAAFGQLETEPRQEGSNIVMTAIPKK